jgi:hypothetical protein
MKYRLEEGEENQFEKLYRKALQVVKIERN